MEVDEGVIVMVCRASDLEASSLMHIMVTFDMQIANDCVDHNTNHGNGPFPPTELYRYMVYALYMYNMVCNTPTAPPLV